MFDEPEQTNGQPAPPVRHPRRRSKAEQIVLGGLLGLIAATLSALVFFVATRERLPLLTQTEYEAAVARWEKNGPASYDVDLELSGNRSGTIHVEVRDGEITRMIRDGVEPSQQRTWYYWSVPGQLDTIGQELEMALDPARSFAAPGASQVMLWAEFDATFGYPRRFRRVVLGANFEVDWRTTQFRVLEK